MERIDLFCGMSSLGMPFPRENKYHVGYFDLVQDFLSRLGYSVDGFNLSSLNKNHTWDLEKVFDLNYSLAKIRNIQMYSIDALRNTNALFKLVIPKRFQKRFVSEPSDEAVTFKDVYVASLKPIFLYSAGPNDFFTYIQAGPVELLDEKVRGNLPSNLQELVYQCVDNVERNWLLLHDLNPNVQIMALSFYYSPLFDLIQRMIFLQEVRKDRSKVFFNKFDEIISLFNRLLFERSLKYDFVEYIDLSFMVKHCAFMDFHPNTEGNVLIAQKIIDTLNKRMIDPSNISR